MYFSAVKKLPDKILALPCWQQCLLSLSSGAISAYAMSPYNLWFLLFAGLSTLYILLSDTNSCRRSFGLTWLFSFGYFVAGLWWISNALLVSGNQFIWVWPFAVLGLPALLALFPAILCAFVTKIFDLKTLAGFLGFIVAITMSEWLRGHIFTGFPWNLFGYSWVKILPMIQVTSIGGVYFLSMLTIFWAITPAYLLVTSAPLKYKKLILAIALLVLSSTYMYGYMRLNSSPISLRDDVVIRIVQPNIPQEEKWNSEFYYKNLQTYFALSQAAEENTNNNKDKTTIIIWPETALTSHDMNSKEIREVLAYTLQNYQGNAFLLSGMLRRELDNKGEEKYFNSLVAYNSQLDIVASYDKSHLVPFGEYIPFKKFIPLRTVTEFAGFVSGNGPVSQTIPNVPTFIPMVCYEIIFPGTIKLTNVENQPEWIVNVTNDAWYGTSPGPYQHFDMAIYRAIEEGMPVVRAANTGISGVIDPLGRTIYRTKLFTKSNEEFMLPYRQNTGTLFSTLRNIPLLIILLTMSVIAICKRSP